MSDLLDDELRAAGYEHDADANHITLRGARVSTTKIHRNVPELRWLAEVTLDKCTSRAYGHHEKAAMITLALRVHG